MTDSETERLKVELEELRRHARTLADDLARTRDQLTEEHNNYWELIERLPLGVFRKDLQLRHTDVSENLCRKLGRSRQDIEGKLDTELSPGPLAEKYQRDDLWVIETGQMFEDIEEHNPVDGEPTYVQTRKMPLRNARGEIVGVQGWFFDVTPLKAAEIALQKRTQELEEALRQLKSNQEQLLVAEKMASLGRLTAGIAHEMNTPLAAVRSALNEVRELIEEYKRSIGDAQVSEDDHREIARDMEKSLTLAQNAAARASAFVRGIKSNTRNVADQVPIDFDVVEVVRESLLLVNHLARRSNCELAFEPRVEHAVVSGVPGRLNQVITNLVTNAIDASRGKGGGVVTIDLAETSGGFCLSVQDQGVGIPENMVNRIFEPMFTTKPFGEGTGLGLSIVADIVKGEFGGRIDLKSVSGTGTTFFVHLTNKKAVVSGEGLAQKQA